MRRSRWLFPSHTRSSSAGPSARSRSSTRCDCPRPRPVTPGQSTRYGCNPERRAALGRSHRCGRQPAAPRRPYRLRIWYLTPGKRSGVTCPRSRECVAGPIRQYPQAEHPVRQQSTATLARSRAVVRPAGGNSRRILCGRASSRAPRSSPRNAAELRPGSLQTGVKLRISGWGVDGTRRRRIAAHAWSYLPMPDSCASEEKIEIGGSHSKHSDIRESRSFRIAKRS